MNKETFIKYFNGSIEEEEEKNLLLWIDECEANRSEFFHERKLWDMFLLNSSSEMMSQDLTLGDRKINRPGINKWAI